MTFLILLPPVLSLLVLAAHFLRAGSPALVTVALGLLSLVPVRRPWAARCLQIALAAGALEWLRTLVGLADERLRAGQPVVRLGAILGGVAVVAGLAATSFSSRRLRRWYRFGTQGFDGNEPG